MKYKRKRPFRRILFRNLICMKIPYALILLTVFFLVLQMTELDRFSVYEAEDYEQAVKEYALGRTNFSISVSNIRYAGFDYKEGTSIKGRYFYFLDENKMRLFLLDVKTSEQILNGAVTELEIKCSVVQDELTANYIEDRYADSLQVAYESIDGYISPYIFSQLAYPKYVIPALRILLILSAALFIILVLYTMLAVIFPWMNPQVLKFRRFGKVKLLIEEVDEDIKEHILYLQSPYIVTKHFLIVAYITKIDIIRLDEIQELTKQVKKVKGLFSGSRMIYRLVVSNVDETFYECEFTDEEVIDDVIDYIRLNEEEDAD